MRTIIFKVCFHSLILFIPLSAAKLVVLDPATIELIYGMGGEDQIAGIAHLQRSNIKPVEKTKNLPSVGTFSHPSVEKILELKPDLVLLSAYSIGLKDQLSALGLKSENFVANSLDDIRTNIIRLGEILGKQGEARELLKSFNDGMDKISANKINKDGLFIYSSTPLMVFGRSTLIGDILETLGVKTVDAPGARPILSPEYILQHRVDFLLYSLNATSIEELIKANPILKNTNAYKNNNFIKTEAHILLRGSQHLVHEIEKLHEILLSFNYDAPATK